MYYPDKKIIHHEMHKYTHGQIFRDALMAGLEAMKKYRAQKWLSDDRNNPALDTADTDWNMAHWLPGLLPRAGNTGLLFSRRTCGKYRLDTLAKTWLIEVLPSEYLMTLKKQ